MFKLRFLVPRCSAVCLVHAVLLLGGITIVGCRGPDDPTIPVYGKVTLNGEPIEHGDIEFGGKGNNGLRRGAMIADGEYRTAPMQGLLPGEYTVRIFSVPAQSDDPLPDVVPGDEGYGGEATRDRIPPEYNMRSTQVITVTADGENEFNFDILTRK